MYNRHMNRNLNILQIYDRFLWIVIIISCLHTGINCVEFHIK
jgi:hypothetical protein